MNETRILLNQGQAHLEPVLDKQKIQSSGLSFSEEDKILKNAQLFNTIRKNKLLKEKLEKVKKHLDEGAEVNASDANDKHNTPLHVAILKGESEIVKFLLERGAKTDSKDNDHETPLDIAKRLNKQNILQVLETHIQLTSQQASVGGPSVVQQPTQEKRKVIDHVERELAKESKIPRHNTKLSVVSGKKNSSLIPSGSDAGRSKTPVATNRRRPHAEASQEEVVQAKRSRISVLDKPKEHPASGLRYTLHGNIYQLKLLMLFLHRGLKEKYSFLLATEMDAAEKFDDLVFQYENKRKDGIEYRFLQAKHKQDESKQITVHDLLTEENDEFSLQKYFISYRKIKQKPEFRGGTLKDFTLCTNINFDFDQLQQAHIEVKEIEDRDDILSMDIQEKSAMRYKFILDTSNGQDRLYQTLKDTSDLRRLAKKLAKHVLDGKKIDLKDSVSDALFASYHVVLAKEVIDTSGQGVKKFHQNFLRGKTSNGEELSIENQQFRKAFIEAAFKMVTVRLFKDFKITELSQAVKLKGPQKTAESIASEFANLIANAKQGHKKKIVLDGRTYKQTSKEEQKRAVANNVDELRYILVGENKQNVRFSHLFINSNHKVFERLPYLKELRTQLEEKLKLKKIDMAKELNQYEFEIKIGSFTPCIAGEVKALLEVKNTLPEDKPESERLAKVLAKHLLNDQKIDLDNPGNEEIQFLKSYYNVLIKEEIIGKIKKDKEFYIKFNSKFLESEDLSKSIRREFLSTCQEAFEGYFIDACNKKEITLSESFGNKNLMLTNPESLAIKMAELIITQQKKGVKIIEIKTEEKEKIVTKQNINVLAGYVLNTQNNEIKFSQDFFNDNNELPGNLNTFKTHLKTALEDTIRFDELKQYQFGIKGFYCQSTLPNDEVKIDDIKDFFNKLVFAVDQPNEVELGVIIKEKIGKEFNLIDSDLIADHIQREMLDWFKEKGERGKEGRFLSHEDGEELFAWAKQKLAKLILIGPTLEYRAKIADFGIEFKQHVTQELQLHDFLAPENRKKILNLSTQHNMLSVIKAYQILKDTARYKKEDSYIFMRLSSLLRIKDRVMQAFASEATNLLVIESQSKSEEESVKELYQELSTVIKKQPSKKIILITKQNDMLANNFKAHPEYVEKVDEDKFSDLTEASQNKLLKEKTVIFQGEEIRLDTLIVSEDQKKIIDVDVLSKLINDDEIKIGHELLSLGEIEHYYIDRTFNLQVEIKQEIFQASKLSDLFAVSNIRENELSKLIDTSREKIRRFEDNDPDKSKPVRFVILDNQKAEGQFKQLIQNQDYKKYSIHWLKKEERKLVWQRSQGSLSGLRGYVNMQSDTKQYNEEEFINEKNNNKVIIVSDTPGMGKSSVLTHLSHQIKENSSDQWVIRIDLNYYTRELKEWKNKGDFKTQDIDKAIEFLSNDLLKLNTPLEQALFRHRCQQIGKVTIMFDGFDEISPDYKEVVVDLVQALRNSAIEQLWVTTRPHMREELEDKLQQFAHTLEPFSEDNQVDFLTKFWKHTLKFYEANQGRLEVYAKALIQLLAQSISDKEKEFTGIPLQTKMLAEAFQETQKQKKWEGCKEFHYSDEDKPDLPKKLDLVDLYKFFVDKKYYIYLEEKRKADLTNLGTREDSEELRKAFEQRHKDLALYTLFNKEELEKIFSEQRVKEIENSFLNKIKEGKERTGIVNEIINDKPHFIHRTFAEYFVADFLVNNLRNTAYQNSRLQKCLLKKLLIKPDYQVIRVFFNGQLAKEHLLQSTLKHYGKKIDKLWLVQKNLRNTEGQTILHIASVENNAKIINFLLDSLLKRHLRTLKSLVQAIDYNEQTALYLAAQEGNLDVVELLIEHGADPNAPGPKCRTPLARAAEKGNLDVVKLLIEKGADVNAADKDGMTPLALAADSGHLDVIKSLIEKEADVNAPNKDGRTPLAWAANSGYLDIVKFLIELGADLKFFDSNADYIDATPINKLAPSFFNNLDVVKLLIELGIDLKALNTNMHGKTHLEWAAFFGNLDVVKFLIEKGADVNVSNRHGFTPLAQAALSGDLDIVKFLIEQGADINVADKRGRTPLSWAASDSRLDVVKFLIEQGADVNAPDEDDRTPLERATVFGEWDVVKCLKELEADFKAANGDNRMPLTQAAQEGNLDVVKYLIEQGADVDAVDKFGRTPLGLAASSSKWDVVKFLIEKGADVSAPNKYGKAPLALAADSGKWNVVKLLIEKGADVNAKDKYGVTPLYQAAQKGNLDVVKFLIEQGADVNAKENDGRTPLYQAVENGNLDVVKFLIEKGADVNAADKHGVTPIYRAAQKVNLDVVKFLIEQGADVNAKENDGRTPLYQAAENGNLDVVKFLIEKGADVNAADEYGVTPLYRAVQKGNLDVVKFLIEQGVDVNAKDNDGRTPLALAADFGKLDVVKFLIEQGADVNAVGKYGRTPLDRAAYSGNWDVVKWLIEQEADVNAPNKDGRAPLTQAAQKGNLDVVKCLIKEKEVNVNAPDKGGKTPLGRVAYSGHLDIVKWLIELGADVNAKDNDGKTPLGWAAKSGNLDVVKFLIEQGANVNVKDNYGRTPLGEAAWPGHLNVVKWLIELGEDVNTKDNDGTAPLALAADFGKLDVVKWLIEQGADVNAKDNDGRTPLGRAAKSGYLDVVKFLIEQGANVNAKEKGVYIINASDINGLTLLGRAAISGNLDVVKFLIEQGADVNAKDNFGITPLGRAAKSGNLDVVKFLIEKGTDVLATNHHDMVLHQAVSGNNEEIIRLVLDKIKV